MSLLADIILNSTFPPEELERERQVIEHEFTEFEEDPAAKAFELNWQIVNTSLSQLKFRGSEVSLASFNSHVHLQLLKAPELITYR